MIFVTVGTEKFPFDRLLKTLDEGKGLGLIEQEIFAQTGSGLYEPKYFQYQSMISFKKMICMINQAKIVVSHAGVGSTILCLSLGKIPIIISRRSELGEHVDNHQVEFAERMDDIGNVIVANNGDLIEKINNYKEIISDLQPRRKSSRDSLILYLKDYISSLEGRPGYSE